MQHQNRRPSAFGFGFFLTVSTPRHPLPATTSFDDGPEISATEGEQRRFLDVERGYRRSKTCKGEIEHRFRQGHFWLGR